MMNEHTEQRRTYERSLDFDNSELARFSNLIPEDLRLSAEKFILFMQDYYRFMHEDTSNIIVNEFNEVPQKAPLNIIQNLSAQKDVDRIDDGLLDYLKAEIAPYVPKSKIFEADPRMLYRLIVKYFYNNRGARESVRVFFKLFYNASVHILDGNCPPCRRYLNTRIKLTSLETDENGVVTATSLEAHGFQTGQILDIDGAANSAYNVKDVQIFSDPTNAFVFYFQINATPPSETNLENAFAINREIERNDLEQNIGENWIPYQYWLQTDVPIDRWEGAYRALIHPIGFRLISLALVLAPFTNFILGLDLEHIPFKQREATIGSDPRIRRIFKTLSFICFSCTSTEACDEENMSEDYSSTTLTASLTLDKSGQIHSGDNREIQYEWFEKKQVFISDINVAGSLASATTVENHNFTEGQLIDIRGTAQFDRNDIPVTPNALNPKKFNFTIKSGLTDEEGLTEAVAEGYFLIANETSKDLTVNFSFDEEKALRFWPPINLYQVRSYITYENGEGEIEKGQFIVKDISVDAFFNPVIEKLIKNEEEEDITNENIVTKYDEFNSYSIICDNDFKNRKLNLSDLNDLSINSGCLLFENNLAVGEALFSSKGNFALVHEKTGNLRCVETKRNEDGKYVKNSSLFLSNGKIISENIERTVWQTYTNRQPTNEYNKPEHQWSSIIAAPNGMVYSIPAKKDLFKITKAENGNYADFHGFTRINPYHRNIENISFRSVQDILKTSGSENMYDSTYYTPNDKILWNGVVYSPNKNLLLTIPFSANWVMTIDPFNNRLKGYSISTKNDIVDDKWCGTAVCANSDIYAAPFNDERILKVDGSAKTKNIEFEYIDINDSSVGKYAGCVYDSSHDKIWFIPHNANSILSLNHNTEVPEYQSIEISGQKKWFGGVLANGKIYCVPYNSNKVCIINTFDNSYELSDFGLNLSGQEKWKNGILAANGKIYCVSYNAEKVLIIDTIHETAELSDFHKPLLGNKKWNDGALALDGKIYTAPNESTNIYQIDTNNSERSGRHFPKKEENEENITQDLKISPSGELQLFYSNGANIAWRTHTTTSNIPILVLHDDGNLRLYALPEKVVNEFNDIIARSEFVRTFNLEDANLLLWESDSTLTYEWYKEIENNENEFQFFQIDEINKNMYSLSGANTGRWKTYARSVCGRSEEKIFTLSTESRRLQNEQNQICKTHADQLLITEENFNYS